MIILAIGSVLYMSAGIKGVRHCARLSMAFHAHVIAFLLCHLLTLPPLLLIPSPFATVCLWKRGHLTSGY